MVIRHKDSTQVDFRSVHSLFPFLWPHCMTLWTRFEFWRHPGSHIRQLVANYFVQKTFCHRLSFAREKLNVSVTRSEPYPPPIPPLPPPQPSFRSSSALAPAAFPRATKKQVCHFCPSEYRWLQNCLTLWRGKFDTRITCRPLRHGGHLSVVEWQRRWRANGERSGRKPVSSSSCSPFCLETWKSTCTVFD